MTLSNDGHLGWPTRRAAGLFGDSTALVCGEMKLTYAQLADRLAGLHAGLVDLGVPPGGRVGFLGVNSIAHVECTLGVPAAGRVIVDLNFRLAPAELEFIVRDCSIGVLVVDATQLDIGRGLRATCPAVRQLVFDGNGPCPGDCLPYESLVTGERTEEPDIAGDSLAAISYTGGTTGAPKGVMLSHGNLLANARHNLICTGHNARDRWLHVCPMFHVAGIANIFACTWVGAQQIVLPRFEVQPVVDALLEHEITHAVLLPTMLGRLLDYLDETSGADFPALEHVQYAGSPISPTLQRRLLERFDFDLVQCYGMTEAAPSVTCLSAADHRRGATGKEPYATRLRSVGVPIVGVEAQVLAQDGTAASPGEIGELCVRGPNVMLGYWNRDTETEAALADGWYHTGDAARCDEDGYLYLLDRLKDMIITGAENVYSIEVESALLEHSAVMEAAVFGIPDARWGEAVHAVVTVREDDVATEPDLMRHCRDLIAGYKIPKSIDVRTEPLPRSAAGKLLKNRLREPFWSGLDRRIG
jgi:long-chain acyl-CoA synthetase